MYVGFIEATLCGGEERNSITNETLIPPLTVRGNVIYETDKAT